MSAHKVKFISLTCEQILERVLNLNRYDEACFNIINFWPEGDIHSARSNDFYLSSMKAWFNDFKSAICSCQIYDICSEHQNLVYSISMKIGAHLSNRVKAGNNSFQDDTETINHSRDLGRGTVHCKAGVVLTKHFKRVKGIKQLCP